jgi:hypothetical protein
LLWPNHHGKPVNAVPWKKNDWCRNSGTAIFAPPVTKHFTNVIATLRGKAANGHDPA